MKRERRMRRYSIQPRFYLFLMAVMLVVFGTGVAVACGRLSGEQQALSQAQARQADMFDQVSELQQELSDAGTREYIERAAREAGMLYPGEVRYVGH